MNSSVSTSKTKRARRRKRPNNQPRVVDALVRYPPARRAIVPSEQYVEVGFLNTFQLAAAALFAVKDYNTNTLHTFSTTDTDPFSFARQMFTIYQQALVVEYSYQYDVASNEPAIPVLFGVKESDEQGSTAITTQALARDAFESGFHSNPTLVGQTTGMDIFKSRRITRQNRSIVGNPPSYDSDIQYTQTASGTDPAAKTFLTFIAISPLPATNITNGIIVKLEVSLKVKFFSLLTIEN